MTDAFEVYGELRTTVNAVCNLNYHIIRCPKYRRSMPKGQLEDNLKLVIRAICETNKWSLLAMEIMEDHIHVFVSTPPVWSPAAMVEMLKRTSARMLYLRHPELKRTLWKGHLWSTGYYIGTAGTINAKSIRVYVEAQKTKAKD